MKKKRVLIVVEGGVAYYYTEDSSVDVRLVDQDNIKAGDSPEELPEAFLGMAELADLKEGKDFVRCP